MSPDRVRRGARATALAAFPLLLTGGWVTTTGSGLADPTWPSEYVTWGFLFKVSETDGGLLYELNHRLVGKIVGALAVATALAATFAERRGWVRILAWGALGAVVLQGIVGGMRVNWVSTPMAIVHACLGQAVFSLLAVLAVVTGASWRAPADRVRGREAARFRRITGAVAGMALIQLVLGAFLRHTGRAVLPHLLLSLVIAGHAIWLAFEGSGRLSSCRAVSAPARILGGLVAVQMLLGFLAWWGRFGLGGAASSRWAPLVATAHVGVGALFLAVCVVLLLQARRHLDAAEQASPAAVTA